MLVIVFSRFLITYSPQNTSWSLQWTRVLRQCKVPLVDVMFVTLQRENIRPLKDINEHGMNMPDVFS
jgi:hypothetical protein